MSALKSWLRRILFAASWVLAGVAVLEKIVNIGGYTIMRAGYTPSRLLELTVITLMFVIALQLEDIRSGRVEATPRM